MKRFFTILMLSLICAFCAIGFAACGENKGNHPHEIVEREIIEKEPTCTSVGIKYIYCDTCGEILKTVLLGKAPHDYEDVIMPPTCTTQGFTTHTCKNCGHIENDTYTDICPHNYIDTITPPTCTEQGYTTHTCKDCGYVTKDTYTAPTGHSYETSFAVDDHHHWHKTTCGHTDAIIKQTHSLDNNGICTVCGYDEHSTLALQYAKINGKEEYAVDELSDDSIKTVYIPDTYNNLPVTKINESAFYGNTGIQKVIMSDNITKIGASAFYGCSALQNIRLSNNLTEISEYTFYGCASLNSITIPKSVKSIQQTVFDYHLAKLNYTGTVDEWCEINFDSSWHGIQDLDFYINNELVTEVNLTIATKINDAAFSGCKKITSVTIPDSVTSIGSGAFYYCSSLTNIIVPDSVISIGSGAFYDCPCIVNNKGVHYVNKWIVGCDHTISSATIKEGTVGIADSAFSYCYNLTSITIPDSIISIGNNFYGCYSLTSIVFNGTTAQWQSISKGDNYLSHCVVNCTDGNVNF